VSQIQRACDECGASLSDYLSVTVLRAHGTLTEKPTAEQIYVHSKLMIVDDRHVIVGSANINDRSMTGVRDSELCLLISPGYSNQTEAPCFLDGTFNGQPYRKSAYALDLRMHLWAEHLGLEGNGLTIPAEKQIQIQDAVSDHAYHGVWRAVAARNAQAFADAFPYICHPSGQLVETGAQLLALRAECDTHPLLKKEKIQANNDTVTALAELGYLDEPHQVEISPVEGEVDLRSSSKQLDDAYATREKWAEQEACLAHVDGHLCEYSHATFLAKQELSYTESVISHTTVPL
jgi:hypothetical protein